MCWNKHRRQTGRQELIDTQWDVNKEDNVLLMLTAFELIDTQWDVNDEIIEEISPDYSELIDTQWDVNQMDSIDNQPGFPN